MNISRKGVGLLVALLAIIFLVFIYAGYQWHTHSQTMSRQISSMTALAQAAGPGATTAENIRVLEELRTEKDRFNSEGMSEEVRQTYEKITADIRKAIAVSYAKNFDDTALPNLEKIDDPSIVADKITELEKQREQVQQQAAALNDSAITDKMLSKIGDRLEKYNSRKTVIEEDKRRAEEEARRKAEEEAARKAQEEAELTAQSRYETEHFLVQIPTEYAGQWTVTTKKYPDGEDHLLRLNNGQAGNHLSEVCGQIDVENPEMNYMGTSSGGCRVFLRLDHQSAATLISPGMAKLTIK